MATLKRVRIFEVESNVKPRKRSIVKRLIDESIVEKKVGSDKKHRCIRVRSIETSYSVNADHSSPCTVVIDTDLTNVFTLDNVPSDGIGLLNVYDMLNDSILSIED